MQDVDYSATPPRHTGRDQQAIAVTESVRQDNDDSSTGSTEGIPVFGSGDVLPDFPDGVSDPDRTSRNSESQGYDSTESGGRTTKLFGAAVCLFLVIFVGAGLLQTTPTSNVGNIGGGVNVKSESGAASSSRSLVLSSPDVSGAIGTGSGTSVSVYMKDFFDSCYEVEYLDRGDKCYPKREYLFPFFLVSSRSYISYNVSIYQLCRDDRSRKEWPTDDTLVIYGASTSQFTQLGDWRQCTCTK